MMTLSKSDLVEILRLHEQENKSCRQIAQIFGCGKSTINDFLTRKSHQEFWEAHDEKPVASGTIETTEAPDRVLSSGVYVFTCAQNNTYVYDDFLKSLENYCEARNASLMIGTFHYNKNAYSKGDEQDSECWFDSKIRKYIVNENIIIADDLLWCGKLDIIPTAVNPMSGFNSYTKHRSGIFPHVKVQMESLPTPKFEPVRFMYSTGTVTQRNYIQRKAGQIASFHHVYGALVVEVDSDGDWFARQLIADPEDASIQDLTTIYRPDGTIEYDCPVEAINWGDVHSASLDPVVRDLGWNPAKDDTMAQVLLPKYQFVHDVFDMKNRNHHNISDPYFRYKMHVENTESVEEEVSDTSKVLSEMSIWSDVKVAQSNHDLALKKWLREQDYRNDPVNAEYFLRLQLATYESIRLGNRDFMVFEYACRQTSHDLTDVEFLGEDESFMICDDIECGQHGHNGNNGARGSIRSFQVQGRKYNTGHTHSASIKDGVYTAGVSGKLDMGYNVGGSSWSHSHIVTYPNGKRTIVTMRNGKWRAS